MWTLSKGQWDNIENFSGERDLIRFVYLKEHTDFPGAPVAKMPCSQCRGPKFNPWIGNEIPQATKKSQHNQIKKINKY